MMTVNEVSKITGLSVRTLHHYDKIGLLTPTSHSDAGYRLYDEAALEKLMQIMLFRTLEFPLDEIKSILNSKSFDRNKALKQHIELLSMKKEHLENLITLAQGILLRGVNHMDVNITHEIERTCKEHVPVHHFVVSEGEIVEVSQNAIDMSKSLGKLARLGEKGDA